MNGNLIDRFDDWFDRHELGIDRFFFWWTLGCAVWWTGLTGSLLADRRWGLAVLTAVGTVFFGAFADDSASDLRDAKRQRGLPTCPPAWRRCLRRWVHVALFGWSS